jgi:DOPA 4,5-dioxygenase
MNYHAHVYFDALTHNQADQLRTRLIETLPSSVRIYPLVPRKVGPHPQPMFEVNFDSGTRDRVLEQLELLRSGLTVLVHEDTGQDFRDHTTGASWLGEPVELDLSAFAP